MFNKNRVCVFFTFFLVLLALQILSLGVVYGQSPTEEAAPAVCDWFKIQEGCDVPSGLDILISVFIGIYLAIIIHMMGRHNQKKLESNSLKIQKNTLRLERIIASQEIMRRRRRNFAIHSFKNHLGSLLSTLSGINDLVTKYTEDKQSKTFFGGIQSTTIRSQIQNEEKVKQQLIQTMRNTIIYASDALDPLLVSKIDELCTTVSQTYVAEQDNSIAFPGFDETKKMIIESSETIGEIESKIRLQQSKSNPNHNIK